jgi:hypothetical protein
MSADRLLQKFDQPVTDREGKTYAVLLFGRSRPGDTWQGWLAFEAADGTRYETGVETTQPNAEAIVYWASGLGASYFDGALERARRKSPHDTTPVPVPPPVVTGSVGTRRDRLADLERAVMGCFASRRASRLLTREVFDALPNANADVVRAIEDLEKQGGLLVRATQDGNDWIILTEAGRAHLKT